MNDWICPCCGKIAFNGENKLKHLSKHIPAVKRLIRREFNLRVGMLFWEKVGK